MLPTVARREFSFFHRQHHNGWPRQSITNLLPPIEPKSGSKEEREQRCLTAARRIFFIGAWVYQGQAHIQKSNHFCTLLFFPKGKTILQQLFSPALPLLRTDFGGGSHCSFSNTPTFFGLKVAPFVRSNNGKPSSQCSQGTLGKSKCFRFLTPSPDGL